MNPFLYSHILIMPTSLTLNNKVITVQQYRKSNYNIIIDYSNINPILFLRVILYILSNEFYNYT